MVAQPMTATVVAMDANGRTAPEYDIRTGSRWPLVSLIPVDAFLPLFHALQGWHSYQLLQLSHRS